jgi:hypothetical protein
MLEYSGTQVQMMLNLHEWVRITELPKAAMGPLSEVGEAIVRLSIACYLKTLGQAAWS